MTWKFLDGDILDADVRMRLDVALIHTECLHNVLLYIIESLKGCACADTLILVPASAGLYKAYRRLNIVHASAIRLKLLIEVKVLVYHSLSAAEGQLFDANTVLGLKLAILFAC